MNSESPPDEERASRLCDFCTCPGPSAGETPVLLINTPGHFHATQDGTWSELKERPPAVYSPQLAR